MGTGAEGAEGAEEEDAEEVDEGEEDVVEVGVDTRPQSVGPGTGREGVGILMGSTAVSMIPTSTSSITRTTTLMKSGGECTPWSAARSTSQTTTLMAPSGLGMVAAATEVVVGAEGSAAALWQHWRRKLQS